MKNFVNQLHTQVRNYGKAGLLMLVVAAFATGCRKDDYHGNPGKPQINSTVVKGSGDISTQLAAFRSILGDSLNTTLPGNPAGRREVNWDGVPPQFTDENPFPFDFFNSKDPAVAAGRKRGVETNGNDLRVSTIDFENIDPSYQAQFDAFSNNKTFADLGTKVMDVVFKVPGTATPASVNGFGVVFSDVDESNSTYMEYYNGSKSLGVFKVPVRSGNTSFSFLGVAFPNEKVTRVKITSGNAVLAPGVKDVSDGGTYDLVIMDDFFYDEPQP